MTDETTRLISDEQASKEQSKALTQNQATSNSPTPAYAKSTKKGNAIAAGVSGFVAGVAVGAASTVAASSSEQELEVKEIKDESIETPEPDQAILANDEGIRYAHVDADNFNGLECKIGGAIINAVFRKEEMKKLIFTLLAVVLTIGVATAKESLLYTYNMNRAYEEGNKGNYIGALEFFDKELKEHPKNGYAYLGKAAIFFEQKQYDDVISSTDKALRLISKKDKTMSARAHLLKGQTLLATIDTIFALSEMTEAIRLDPKFTDAYDKRGQVYYEQNKYDLAGADYKKLIELNPADLMGYKGLGRNFQAKGQHDEAIRLFNKVVGMYPDYSSGYAFRAESYLKLGKYLEAADDIMKALSIDNDAKAHHYLFEFPDGKTTLLVTKLKGMAVKNPHNAEWHYYMGQLYNDKKMYQKAIEALKEGYNIDAHPIFLELIADCYQSLGDFHNALSAINEAQQMRPDDMDLISTKADVLGESGDIDGAIAEWNRYIEKSPDFFYGYYRRGFYEDNSGRTDDALTDYDMAIMLEPKYVYAYLGKGDMLMRKGETDKAIEAYRKVVELDTVANNQSCAMYALLALGERDKAVDFMQQIITNDSIDCGNYYDGACFYSLIGDLDKSLANLRNAFEHGFRRFHHVMADDDLEALRATPRFEELMKEYNSPISESDESSIPEGMVGLDYEITKIPFTPDGCCVSVKCTINDLPLSFIFDTGANTVSLSMVEANFMLKNGYLKKDDFVGSQKFVDANGNISEGTVVNLRNVDFGGLHLNNVRASIVRNQKAPLLLGQTVLSRLGSIEIDNSGKKLIIKR